MAMGDVDADPSAVERMRRVRGCATTAERIEDGVAGIGRGDDDVS